MDILSTLKSEYSRTLILILIPGAIAIEPFALMLYEYYNLHVENLKDYFIYAALLYFLGSLFAGFLLQDLGARLEVWLDIAYCKISGKKYNAYKNRFELYLFNKVEEDFFFTRYYRSLLIRLKFELHTIWAIVLLWVGMSIRSNISEGFSVSHSKTNLFILISGAVFVYLLLESYDGVRTLNYWRERINAKLQPSFDPESKPVATTESPKN